MTPEPANRRCGAILSVRFTGLVLAALMTAPTAGMGQPLPPPDSDSAKNLTEEASKAYEKGDFQHALMLLQTALNIQKSFRPDPPDTISALNNLAALYQQQGRYSEAEPLLKESLEISAKNFGASPGTAVTLNNLGTLYQSEGRWATCAADSAERVRNRPSGHRAHPE